MRTLSRSERMRSPRRISTRLAPRHHRLTTGGRLHAADRGPGMQAEMDVRRMGDVLDMPKTRSGWSAWLRSILRRTKPGMRQPIMWIGVRRTSPTVVIASRKR